jgi:DNA-directed RNA polymerase alpha subunit
MKIHVEFNSVAEMANFSKFVQGGLLPHSDVKFKDKDKPAVEDPYKQKYEITLANLERALHRLRIADPKGVTANYDVTPVAPLKGTRVEELELSVRAENCLKAEGIYTIEELCTKPRNYLRKLPNLGKITLNEIIDALAERKLKLKGEA